MKTAFTFASITLALVAGALCAAAQGTAFTYQGRLNDAGTPASGTYDLTFTVYGAVTGGSPVAGPHTNSALGVSNGLFTVTLDFGSSPFNTGLARWLEIAARTNGAASFTNLSPRQPFTATPYAITASNLTGTLPAAQLTGTIQAGQIGGSYSGAVAFGNAGNTFAGSGAGLANVNAAKLGGFAASNFWNTAGNTGVNPTNGGFLGTVDNLPLEIRVNNQRALRLEPTGSGPNVIGGSAGNVVQSGTSASTIGGGDSNTIQTNATWSTISGGSENVIETNSSSSAIAGGQANVIENDAYNATIGGGSGNRIHAGAAYSTISGGLLNALGSFGSALAGGQYNVIATGASWSAIGGGYTNFVESSYCDIAGGTENLILSGSFDSAIGGGTGNVIQNNSPACVIGGGAGNAINANAYDSTIIGGGGNTIQASADHSTICGGLDNSAAGQFSFAAGQRAKAAHKGAFVWADSQAADFSSTAVNQFCVRAGGGLLLAGDVQIGTSSGDYHHVQIGGGNSSGFLYGSYLALADGIHLGYNFYYDAAGTGHVYNSAGATSRLTTGYGFIDLAVGNVNGPPTNVMLHATSGGVTVFGTFNNLSDRNAKRDFAPVSPAQILAKVAQLPISEWSYKADAGTRHLGPVAQDFYSIFNLGTDEKHLAPIDEGGVALAAIQGLNQKLEARSRELEAANAELRHKNESLEKRLEALEQIIPNQIRVNPGPVEFK